MSLSVSHSGIGGFSGASGSISISANAGDLIVFVIGITAASGNTAVSSISGAGLNWIKRVAVPIWASGGQIGLEEWYAITSGAISAQSITVNVTGVGGLTADVNYIAVSAAGTYDLNSVLPARQSGQAGNPASGVISTSNANTIIIGALGTNGSAVGGKQPTGFNDVGVGSNSIIDLAYAFVSVVESNMSIAWQAGAFGSGNWGMILDAIDPPLSYDVLGLASSEW